jgi:hypothetical protein
MTEKQGIIINIFATKYVTTKEDTSNKLKIKVVKIYREKN